MAVGRRAAAHDRDGARPTPRRSASTSRGWPARARRARARHRVRARDDARGAASRRPPSTASRCSRCPTSCRSSPLTEKAFSHLVNEQYAVLRRALAAHERLERIVLSEQGLDGVASALAALIGGPALIFDGARRGARAPSGRGRRPWPPSSAPSCASAPGGRAARLRPGGELEGRALALPVRARRGRRRRARPQAWLVAAKDRGRADGVRPPHAPPGRDDRRARAAAPADGRRHRAPAGRRRADRAGVRRARGRGARAAAGAVRARRPRRDGRARAAAQVKAAVEDALARACATRPAPAWSPGPAASRARCSPPPKGGDDELFALAERVRAAGHARRRRRADRRAPAARRRRRRCGARSTRRAARSRRASSPAGGGDGAAGSRPTATSAPSSCCSRCRTTRRCACSATRSSPRSRTARAPTAAS